MDAVRFDRFTRAVVGTASRRVALGLGAAGLLGALGRDAGNAKKRKKKCKKCGPCQKCKKGKCKPKADDTACQGTGKCIKGQCNSLPICVQALDACPPADYPVECCSGHCTVTPYFGCSYSGPGGLCIDSDDCLEGACVGYRCQAA